MSGAPRHCGYCTTHGKLAYSSRKRAKKACRHFREPGAREYRCSAMPGLWHWGPALVRQGAVTMREFSPGLQP